ncbi:MAG: peptidase M61 [Chitinophagales bacterium]
MKHPFLLIVLLLVYCNVFGDVNNTSSENGYKFSLNLNEVENDELMVSLIAPTIQEKVITYYIPKIIPGTYSISDFGRFVHKFKAFEKNGKQLKVKRLNDNSWQIKKANKIHKITYWVEDTFDADMGDNQIYPMSGTNIEDKKNMVINTHGFFGYFEGMKNLPYELSVTHPENFYGSTGLIPKEVSKDKDVYLVEDYMRLADSPMMYNEPDTTIVKVADTEVLVSVYSPTKIIESGYLAEGIKELLMAQKEYLGGELPVKKYAFIMYFVEPFNAAPIQGALEHSYSSFYYLPEYPQTLVMPFIRDIAAHEFFHIVSPLNIHSEEIQYFDYNTAKLSKHLWLYEGNTEYFASNVQVKYGLIEPEAYFDVLRSKIINSQNNYDDHLPFTEMSKYCADKYADQYQNVYEKGALISMSLDLLLLNLSEGEYGMQDLIADLSKKYGKDKPFKDDELFDEIVEMTYPEVKDFFERYVAGPESLPLEKSFAYAGVSYKPEANYNDYSFGNVTLSFNPETERLLVDDTENMNALGKQLGYMKGDEIVKMNGQEVPKSDGIREFIYSFKEGLEEGKEFSITVLRPNEDGESEEVVLKGNAMKVERTALHEIKFMETPSSRQMKVRNAWLRAFVTPMDAPAYRATSEEVGSIEGITAALYNVISGPAGQRNWSRLKALCKPTAQFNALVPTQEGDKIYQTLSLEEYIGKADPFFLESGFYEVETGQVVEEFNGIAQVFSSYETRTEQDGEPFTKGINSIQLVYDQGRWWIVNILWGTATDEHKIPKKYLKSGK